MSGLKILIAIVAVALYIVKPAFANNDDDTNSKIKYKDYKIQILGKWKFTHCESYNSENQILEKNDWFYAELNGIVYEYAADKTRRIIFCQLKDGRLNYDAFYDETVYNITDNILTEIKIDVFSEQNSVSEIIKIDNQGMVLKVIIPDFESNPDYAYSLCYWDRLA